MKQTIVITLIVITLSLTMSGCVAPTGEWEFDGTVKHTGDEVVPSSTPEIVYVTQTPEIIYVTVTPTPEPERSEVVDDSRVITIGGLEPEPIPTSDMGGEDIELEKLIPKYNLPRMFEMIYLETHDDLVVGTYTVEGETYHTNVAVIRYTSLASPASFVEEYKNKPEFENSPSLTVSRFGKVTFDGHEATEVRTVSPTGDIRYGYVWSMDRYVYILEPGASDRSASLELARMIGTHEPASTPTCECLDLDVLRRYDHDKNGLIDCNEMETAKIGYDNYYETQSDYAQIVYAYKHSCHVCPPAPEPISKARYPSVAEFDIENRDSPGNMCHLVIQLEEDGYVLMNSDCEDQTVAGRWALEFDGTESWVYSITAYGDTTSLHLKSGGKAELYLSDVTEYGRWG